MKIEINGKPITTGKLTRTAKVASVGALNLLATILTDGGSVVKDVAKIWK